jgi:hypothetical protein
MVLTMVLLAAPAFALDASIPDASAGMGGADMTSEENQMSDPCLSARDCERGFACTNGRCVPGTVKMATTSGCGGSLAVMMLPLAAGLVLSGRRLGR